MNESFHDAVSFGSPETPSVLRRWAPAIALPLLALGFAISATTAFLLFGPHEARTEAPALTLASSEELAGNVSAPARQPGQPSTTVLALTRRHPRRAPTIPQGDGGLDPAAQAIWNKTVEEDQQTLQPDDLIEEPRPPRIDLRTIPAYRDLNIDENGNVN